MSSLNGLQKLIDKLGIIKDFRILRITKDFRTYKPMNSFYPAKFIAGIERYIPAK